MAANKKEISSLLHRNLKSGKEYDKLIPPVRCQETPLGEGDTFFTVDAMKDWIEKFSHQTAKLAPQLAGHTLEETVDNIYRFLYSHIQYQADGALQQLRSPACTWMQRKEGVDCKSFSVFASSILSNLGIKHLIRQIRQPYFFPEQFTHVYVVVPVDQKKMNNNSATLVLDATKHQNIESNYLEKVDLPMKLQHIGLNAPQDQQDQRTQRIVENFDRFSRFLLEKGAPLDQVNTIRQAVSYYTSQGKDPKMTVEYDGLTVEGVLYPITLTQHVPFLAVQQALAGKSGLSSPAMGHSGLGFSFSEAFDGDVNIEGLAASGGIVDAGVEIAAGALPFGGLIKGLLENLDLANNIKNILKYGLSSWGASMTPEEMKKRFAEICYPWLEQMLASTTPANVDTQMTAIDVNLRANQQFFKKLMENHSRAKSTRIANEWASNECKRLLQETIDEFNRQFQANNITVRRRTVGARDSALSRYPMTSFSTKANLREDRYWDEISYYIYEVDKGSLNAWNSQMASGGSNSGNTSGGDTGSVNTGSAKGKSNTGLIVGGVALASLPFLLPMIKKSKK